MFIAYDVALDLVRALRPVVAQLRGTAPRPLIRSSGLRAASYSTSPKAVAAMAAIHGGSGTSRTAVPGRSWLRSIWQMRGAGRSTARRRVCCSIAS